MKNAHRLFVLKYVEVNDATQAYQYAYPGATKKTAKYNGYKLLKRPDVKEFLKEKQQELEDNAILKISKIQEMLSSMAMDSQSSRSIKLKALDQLTKMLGGYNHVIKTDNTHTNISYDSMTDEELEEALKEAEGVIE